MKADLNFLERRLDMLMFISRVRETHYKELTKLYKVSAPTIKKDLDFIESYFNIPLVRVRGNMGKIKIYGDWSFHFKELSAEQKSALQYAIMKIDNAQMRSVLKSIINEFSNPPTKLK